jgi:glycosyltransferase involved in cell wall biosynthesis
VLKGNDEMYDSNRYVAAALASLEAKGLGHTVRYLGGTFNFSDMAALYQASDALVSPYRAEGFNLPVLEAVATGLPVIVSRGGPTDEFTTPQFARYVRSRLVTAAGAAGVEGERRYHVDNGAKAVDLEPDEDDLLRHLQDVPRLTRWRERARVAGPLHVRRVGYTWKGIARVVAEVLNPTGCGGESEGGGRGGEGEETSPTGGRDGGERETA